MQWALITEFDQAEVFAPIYQMIMLICITVAVFAVLILFIAIATGRGIGNPLKKLTAVAGTMADGDFTVALATNSATDEIGMMTTAFSR